MSRILLIPLGLIALLIAALAWSGGTRTQRAQFAFINRGDIITLDLNQMSYLQDFRVTNGIREGLYTYNVQTLDPEPALVVKSDLSEDKRVWTFHLRPEARWSNGDPVTAHDFLFSWRRMLEEPGEYTYLFYYIKGAREYENAFAENKAVTFDEMVGVRVLNDYTLQVTLTDPVPFLEDLFAFAPFFPRHEKSMEPFKTVDAKTGKVAYLPEYTRPPHVVTNGPFELVDWDFKRRLLFKKSEQYWDKENVKLDNIEMVVNENSLSQLLAYEAGGVDWLSSVDPDIAAELREKGRQDLHISPAFGTSFLTFNCLPQFKRDTVGGQGNNPLSDMRVRQALAMAIDKNFIVKNITRLGEPVSTTYIPPGSLPGYQSTPGLGYDVARARALLAEAGYPGGKGFPRLGIVYNNDSPVRRGISQSLQSQWRQALGIDLELYGVELKQYRDKVTNKEYAIAPVGWYGDYMDASTFTDKYLSTSLQNDAAWENAEYDELCHRATKEPDPEKRLRLLEQAERMINHEVPIVPLYTYTNAWMHRDDVKGIYPNVKLLTMFKGIDVER